MLFVWVSLLLLAGPSSARGLTIVEEEAWEQATKGGPEGEWNWVADKQGEAEASATIIIEEEDNATDDSRVGAVLSSPHPTPVVYDKGNLDAVVANLVKHANEMLAATNVLVRRALERVSDEPADYPSLRVLELTESVEFMRLELQRRTDSWVSYWDQSAAARKGKPLPTPSPLYDFEFDYDYEYRYDTKAIATAKEAQDLPTPHNDEHKEYDTKVVANYEYEYHYDVGWTPRGTLEEQCVSNCKQTCYTTFCDDHCSSGVCLRGTTYSFDARSAKWNKFEAGYQTGHEFGYERGKQDARAEKSADYNHGYEVGYDFGYDAGVEAGYAAAHNGAL